MPAVLLRVTPKMRAAFGAFRDLDSLDEGDTDITRRTENADKVTLDDLRRVSSRLCAQHGQRVRDFALHALVQGSALDGAPPKVRERSRNPELQARLDRIETARQNEEYAAMVRDVTSSAVAKERESTEVASFKASVGVGANLLVTMATMFTAGWFVTRNALNAGATDVLPIIGGLAGAAGAMFLETWLFVIRTARVDKKCTKHEEARHKVDKRTQEQQHTFTDLARVHDHYY